MCWSWAWVCSLCCACGLCLMTTAFEHDHNQCRELTYPPAPYLCYPQPPRSLWHSCAWWSLFRCSEGFSRFGSSQERWRGCEIRRGSGVREGWEESGDGELVAEAHRGKSLICGWGVDKMGQEWRVNHTGQYLLPWLSWHLRTFSDTTGKQDVFLALCTRHRPEVDTAEAMLAVLHSVIYLSFPQLIRCRLHS